MEVLLYSENGCSRILRNDGDDLPAYADSYPKIHQLIFIVTAVVVIGPYPQAHKSNLHADIVFNTDFMALVHERTIVFNIIITSGTQCSFPFVF
jgi:hypothetical protein